MNIDVLTIFPDMFNAVLGESIVKRAQEKGVVRISVHDLRKWTHDSHRSVDDKPFGGGPGMVMKPGPMFEAVEALRMPKTRVILLSPQGQKLDQEKLKDISQLTDILLICGHYEGVDERIREALVDEEISIGDYILSGGELPAMVLIDALVRLQPGALGDERSSAMDSFEEGLLEYPQYTRPRVYRKMEVPEVLLSGDHEKIEKWRNEEAKRRTQSRRPDLLRRQGA